MAEIQQEQIQANLDKVMEELKSYVNGTPEQFEPPMKKAIAMAKNPRLSREAAIEVNKKLHAIVADAVDNESLRPWLIEPLRDLTETVHVLETGKESQPTKGLRNILSKRNR